MAPLEEMACFPTPRPTTTPFVSFWFLEDACETGRRAGTWAQAYSPLRALPRSICVCTLRASGRWWVPGVVYSPQRQGPGRHAVQPLVRWEPQAPPSTVYWTGHTCTVQGIQHPGLFRSNVRVLPVMRQSKCPSPQFQMWIGGGVLPVPEGLRGGGDPSPVSSADLLSGGYPEMFWDRAGSRAWFLGLLGVVAHSPRTAEPGHRTSS